MVWFDDGDPAEFITASTNFKIGLWPISNGPRIDPRFRLRNGEGKPAPRGSQFFVRFQIEDGPPAVYKNCLIPMAPIGDQELEGTSGVSADGYEFILRIKSWTTGDPIFGDRGHEHQITYKHDGFPDFFVRQMYGVPFGSGVLDLNIKVENPFWTERLGPDSYIDDYDPLVNTDVDVLIMQDNWQHWPLSE